MCGIIMLIFGVIAMVNGKFSLTRTKVVEGTPARIVGLMLILPLPVTFVLGLGLGVLAGVQKIPLHRVERVAWVIDIGILVLFLALAIGIAAANAKPAKKRRRSRDEDRYENDDYDDYVDDDYDDYDRPRRGRRRPIDEEDSGDRR